MPPSAMASSVRVAISSVWRFRSTKYLAKSSSTALPGGNLVPFPNPPFTESNCPARLVKMVLMSSSETSPP